MHVSLIRIIINVSACQSYPEIALVKRQVYTYIQNETRVLLSCQACDNPSCRVIAVFVQAF